MRRRLHEPRTRPSTAIGALRDELNSKLSIICGLLTTIAVFIFGFLLLAIA